MGLRSKPPVFRRCRYQHQNGGYCGREMIGGLWCPVHDRCKCTCGIYIVDGRLARCPNCGRPCGLNVKQS